MRFKLAVGVGNVYNIQVSCRFLESFGKLCKLIMQVSRTKKVLEKERFFQNGYGKVLDVCWKVRKYTKIDII